MHSSQALILPAPGSPYDASQDATFGRRGLFSTAGKSREDLLWDVLERIGRELEACQQEIRSRTSSEKEISKLLAHIITQSLQSRDPKQTVKSHLRILRRSNQQRNIIQQVATGLDLPPPLARQLLLNYIKKEGPDHL